ncbi:c-type cytochrome [Marinospirillum alkaliphilum]|uniref:Cytochrome c n=1 Tax=Marinospirillum alkaliphilum DSM 21637 TaxID=1122209 RepID=A0A1K1Y371_9GAMM|nr:c-type cytochrome [Marinospirillum alkaliphilum]SFX56473.1 Cytochrome c [Marinospirillum alkaliphilum DSM 21637]
MKTNRFQWLLVGMLASCVILPVQAEQQLRFPVNPPQPREGQLLHTPPTMDDLEAARMHPELKRVIRRGHDLFMNTQQLRGKNVFNDMNCSSCHMGEGRMPFASPVWPAAVVLPNYRPKNDHVNNLEERIAGCFSYSMNGIPPEYGSDDMVALAAYHQWLAKGVPIYQLGDYYGRGYPIDQPSQEPSHERGHALYENNCAICHSSDGSGMRVKGETHFPAVWGDLSYNWGAGIIRNFTLAGFIHHNMPLGQPYTMSVQDAWDIAVYINSHERPQDPRYEGDVRATRARYLESFHKHGFYGTEQQGRLLGDHRNTGEKPILKPEVLRARTFTPQ